MASVAGPRVLGVSLPWRLSGGMVLTGEDLQAAIRAVMAAMAPASSQGARVLLCGEGVGLMLQVGEFQKGR